MLPVPVGRVPPEGSGLTWIETGVGAKPQRIKRAPRRFGVAHKMGDMIEKDFVAGGKLAVDLVWRG